MLPWACLTPGLCSEPEFYTCAPWELNSEGRASEVVDGKEAQTSLGEAALDQL